ncbi:HEPN domain-containing protein [Methylomonas sp. LL1]|uniref:HEPN domain-containing protein n=1 Tax=Methylomonas sp. LL1 TaxID=2785785 RepID=UPI0018C43460|nr:HEPN domain-containing protein [Methylomonas sp. LL1]QPK62030.1 HEPN domain-containing protein [Methylomonas sp. LL1]
MKYYNTEINWKGIGDYISAARTISQHGTSNTSGPRIHCQGLALELALKYYLWDKNGAYPGTHDLEALAFNKCQDLNFSDEEIVGIKNLNSQYLVDGEFPYPSRYRPSAGRVFVSISQDVLEIVISKIIQNTSHPELVKRILAR